MRGRTAFTEVNTGFALPEPSLVVLHCVILDNVSIYVRTWYKYLSRSRLVE